MFVLQVLCNNPTVVTSSQTFYQVPLIAKYTLTIWYNIEDCTFKNGCHIPCELVRGCKT